MIQNRLRLFAEEQFAEELDNLAKQDTHIKPYNWKLSPQAVVQYIIGGILKNGFIITPKYIGDKRLIEIAVATLTTDRALLLFGLPGTAKSWVSEHLAAAISGSSALTVQGTAGTSEDSIRYGWNYAMLLAKGPTKEAIVETPVLKAMREGKIVRIEELTRINADVQDALITILSEKTLPVAELSIKIDAIKGFNLIATANNRDKGVNELSSALKRRFNTVILPLPASIEEEVKIVQQNIIHFTTNIEKIIEKPILNEIQRIVTIFRELRSGITIDGKTKLKIPSGTLSTAEAISVTNNSLAMAYYFGDSMPAANEVASSIVGTIIKDPVQDKIIFSEYLETVVRQRDGWKDIYHACKESINN